MRRRHALVLMMLAVALTGCAKKHADDDEENHASTPPVVAVKTAMVTEGNIDVVVAATGKTDALRNVKVLSPVAGRILSLRVLEGKSVRAGDVIATIQTKESYGAITGAEAMLQSATTEAARQEAQRTLDLARSTQSTVSIRAKSGGIVATRNASEGEIVAENAELVTLLDLSSIIFTADALLRDLPSLHIGQPGFVRFQSLPGREYKATVDAINPQTDIQSQTVKVRLRFRELSGSALRTDMLGTVRIITETHTHALLVPRAALLHNDEANTFSLVVVEGDSLTKNVLVAVVAMTDSTGEIVSADVLKGMHVIVEGNYALTDSTKVTVVH